MNFEFLCLSKKWQQWYSPNIAFSFNDFWTYFFVYNFTDFFSIKKSGNHFERDSGEFSFRSHSNLKMGDNVLREIQNILEYSTLEYAIVTQK